MNLEAKLSEKTRNIKNRMTQQEVDMPVFLLQMWWQMAHAVAHTRSKDLTFLTQGCMRELDPVGPGRLGNGTWLVFQ